MYRTMDNRQNALQAYARAKMRNWELATFHEIQMNIHEPARATF